MDVSGLCVGIVFTHEFISPSLRSRSCSVVLLSTSYTANRTLAGGTRRRIAAVLAARAGDESAAAQNAQQLGGVGRRERFRLADLRNRQALVRSRQADAQQAAQSVFFVRAQFHGRTRDSLSIGMISSRPNNMRASGDMRLLSHGGSNVSSSFTSFTTGTARALRSTSAGRLPATGQFGAVRVILIYASPAALTFTS